jgi:hypothetical protein
VLATMPSQIWMFKHVQVLNGQGLGDAETLSRTSLGELVNSFHHQASIDHARFLQFCDEPPGSRQTCTV